MKNGGVKMRQVNIEVGRGTQLFAASNEIDSGRLNLMPPSKETAASNISESRWLQIQERLKDAYRNTILTSLQILEVGCQWRATKCFVRLESTSQMLADCIILQTLLSSSSFIDPSICAFLILILDLTILHPSASFETHSKQH